jgi:hypothetical protein
MVMVCVEEYEPAAGLKVGAVGGTIGGVMVYKAEFTELGELPVATAIAARVSVVPTVMAPEYMRELVVGVVPLVV